MSDQFKMRHPQIMTRILNKPLLMDAAYSKVFINAIAQKSDVSVAFIDASDGSKVNAGPLDLEVSAKPERAYSAVNGIAILPVDGALVHKYGHMQPYSGMTGYDSIATRVALADADEDIHTILLDINSPGGEVSGCRETAAAIRAAGTRVVAYVDEQACSAAYWIASAADMIVAPETASIGSIGVVWMHADHSKMLKNEGVDVTFIHAGKHKVDGNPYAAMSKTQVAAFQKEIDTLYGMFVDSVADGRADMSSNQIRDTEARVYLAAEALELGLIDQISSKNDFLNALSSNREAKKFTMEVEAHNLALNTSKGLDMSSKETQADASFSQADLDAAVAKASEDARTAAATEIAAATKAASDRAVAIHSHATASADLKALMSTDAYAGLTTDAVVAILDAEPAGFSAIMDNEGGAGLEAAPSELTEPDDKAKAAEAQAAAADALAKSNFSPL